MAGTVALAWLSGCTVAPPSTIDPAASLRVGGPCRYTTAAGFARVRNVFPEAGNLRVEFDLSLPSGFDAPAWYRADSFTVLFEGAPGNAEEAGLTPGSSHTVQVSVITNGTCTPVLYRFPGKPWTVL